MARHCRGRAAQIQRLDQCLLTTHQPRMVARRRPRILFGARGTVQEVPLPQALPFSVGERDALSKEDQGVLWTEIAR